MRCRQTPLGSSEGARQPTASSSKGRRPKPSSFVWRPRRRRFSWAGVSASSDWTCGVRWCATTWRTRGKAAVLTCQCPGSRAPLVSRWVWPVTTLPAFTWRHPGSPTFCAFRSSPAASSCTWTWARWLSSTGPGSLASARPRSPTTPFSDSGKRVTGGPRTQ